MAVMYARLQEGKRERGDAVPAEATALFVAGYLHLTLVGLGLQRGPGDGRSLSIDASPWDRAGPYVAGGVIVAAAAYQLTPLKDACHAAAAR